VGAQTVDRIAVSVGNIGITESEIRQELLFEQFMDGQPHSARPDGAQLDAARARLVRQTLLIQEIEAEGLDSTGVAEEAGRLLDEIRKLYPDEESYQSALSTTGLTQDQAVERLMNHVRILRLIEQKFRPNAWVEPSEIEAYYQKTIVPEYARDGGTPPPLGELEKRIRELLLQQEVDQLLDEWLKEIESVRRVKVHPS
jgi:hypothetical protein